MPEGQRFVALGAAASASIPLLEIPSALWRAMFARSTRLRPYAPLAVLTLVALFSSWHLVEWEFSQSPSLTVQRIAAAAWLRTHTPGDARFLVLSSQQDAPEWFPFLARRAPVVGHWGAEWTGRYDEEGMTTRLLEDCATRQSWHCVRAVLKRQHVSTRYVVLLDSRRLVKIKREITAQRGLRKLYANSDTVIWRAARSSL
jgi:hypothetical protein